MVVMSGRVLWDSHNRLPTIRRIWSMVDSDAWVGGGLMESTGRPLRYGVGEGLDVCRLVVCRSESINAGWDM